MSNDLITQVCRKLGLSETSSDRAPVNRDDAMIILRELTEDIQHSQQAVGMVLWHLDPSPAELAKIAEELGFKAETLRSWVTTYSRLRHDANLATVRFSMQQQLARVQNDEDRTKLWLSRPPQEWTLAALTSAVDTHMDAAGASVMPRTKKAGCVAKIGDRKLKATVTLAEDVVLVDISVSDGAELSGGELVEVGKGMYRVRYTW